MSRPQVKTAAQRIIEALPRHATVVFGEDGGEFEARWDGWHWRQGWACNWSDIHGPPIHGRLTVYSVDQGLAVLRALGATRSS